MSSPALPRTSPSVVGRQDELAQINALLGEGGVLTLIGEAGLGKTRLVHEALAMARSLGWATLEGRASSGDAELPLAPVRDALRGARRFGTLPTPADPLAAAFPGMVLPELRGGGSGDEPGRDVIFEAAARWTAAIGRDGLLLVLEDLHWADPTTHQLVPRLARSLANERIAFLLTSRPHEAEEGATLDEMRRELARERLGAEVGLRPLEPDAVDALLRGLLGIEPEPAVARFFAKSGGGNPFVTEELVRAAVEAGRLDPGEGVWRGPHAVELPWTVSEMVLSRLRRLEEADQDLARWAAVAGERFDAGLLRSAGAWSEEGLLASLSRLRATGFLQDEGGGAMAFRHALTHEAVLGSLVAPDRRRRHARLLAAAEELADAGSEVPLEVLLGHALGSGRRAEAFRYAHQAAERSLELGGEMEAAGQIERALELWSPGEGAEVRAELLLQHGRLLHWAAQDLTRAAEALGDARRAFLALGERHRAALATALWASARWWSGEREAIEDLRGAQHDLAGAPIEMRLEVLSTLARPLMLDGHLGEAARIAEEGLALVPPRPTRQAAMERIDLLITLGSGRLLLGDLEAGTAMLLESAQDASDHHDHVGACRAYHNLVTFTYDLRDVVAHARAGLALTRKHGLRAEERWFLLTLAFAETESGRFRDAERLLGEAEGVPFPWHPDLVLRSCHARLALARGRFAEAREEFAAVLAGLRAAGESHTTIEECALAEACLCLDDPSAAREALAPALERTAVTQTVECILALTMAARVSAATGDSQEATRIAQELAGKPAPLGPWIRFARALAAGLTGALDAAGLVEDAAREHERAGRRLEAAAWRLAAAEALSRQGRPEAADVAARALEDFRNMSADGWSQRAERLLRRLGQRVPSRASGTGRGGLTVRELEVLQLLTEGASNRAIAERLVISESTAIRHVANVFAKLSVHTRAQAVRVALENQLLETPPAAST